MFSVASPLWANAAFALISAPLTFLLVYQYFLPYNPTNAPQRPKTLYWLLIATVSSLFVACVLNVVYHAQQIPTTDGGPSLHIHNLVLGGWITLMVFASISRTIPLTLLLFAFAVLLLSRWNVLANQFSRTKDSAKSPYPESSELPFLGWKWKKAAVYMTTTALVVLPIASNLSLSIGIATHTTVSSQDGTFKNTVASLSRSVQRLVLAWDGINAAFVAIAIIDIGISTLLLSRKLRSSRYVDPVIDITLLFFVPLLSLLALQTVITSSFHTMGDASAIALAKVDLAGSIVNMCTIIMCTTGLSILYANPTWWALAVLVSEDVEVQDGHELEERRVDTHRIASTKIVESCASP